MLGKLLRIDPAAPGSPTTVYARGLRNPYRFSFDLSTDPGQPRIAIADVGQNRFEEIDYLSLAAAQGANFGWNDFEGFARLRGPPTDREPDREADQGLRDQGRACAVVGGYVVRDARLRGLFRRYVYGDFCAGWVRSLIPDPRGTEGPRLRDPDPRAELVRGGADGSLYATSLGGPVYRFVRKR
jgi:glucose/arabinose dehydrogenase